MNPTPHSRDLLRQQMDACRPGSDDLALAEMAELAAALQADPALRSEWENRQRSELRLAAAMHDLPVPAGLADRILAAARQADLLAGAAEQAVAAEADPAAQGATLPPERKPRLARRPWMYVGGAALVLVAAAAIWPLLPAPSQQISREQLGLRAQGWFAEAIQRQGSPESGASPVVFPASSLKLSPQAWRKMPTKEEPSLVAFDLTNVRLGGSVFLFAADTRDHYAVAGIPYTSVPATGGLAIGAWQEGRHLYVVVIDAQHSGLPLDAVIKSPKLAWAPPTRH